MTVKQRIALAAVALALAAVIVLLVGILMKRKENNQNGIKNFGVPKVCSTRSPTPPNVKERSTPFR